MEMTKCIAAPKLESTAEPGQSERDRYSSASPKGWCCRPDMTPSGQMHLWYRAMPISIRIVTKSVVRQRRNFNSKKPRQNHRKCYKYLLCYENHDEDDKWHWGAVSTNMRPRCRCPKRQRWRVHPSPVMCAVLIANNLSSESLAFLPQPPTSAICRIVYWRRFGNGSDGRGDKSRRDVGREVW